MPVKKKKKRNKLSLPLKILIALVILFSAYQIFQIAKVKNLTGISLKLEQAIGRKLLEHDIKAYQILKRFQTEKSERNVKWIKFTKEIEISPSKFSDVISDLKKIAWQESVKVLDLDEAQIKIGINEVVLNHLIFKILEDKNLIALIVDDVGYTKNIKPFLELNIPLTYAILPELPYSTVLAKEFKRSNIPFILHMPMEPKNLADNNPGELALLTRMDREQILKNLNKALTSVQGARGLNNHMGSKFTSDIGAMNILLKIIKEKKMFFIDSATSSDTVGMRTALEMGVPSAINNFFIDNRDDISYLIKRLEKLKKLASKRKKTIAICHITRKNTANALKNYIPRMEKENIKFVSVEEILR